MRLVSYTSPLYRQAGIGKAITEKCLPFNRVRRPIEASDSTFSLPHSSRLTGGLHSKIKKTTANRSQSRSGTQGRWHLA